MMSNDEQTQPDSASPESSGERMISWLFAALICAAVSAYIVLNWGAVIPQLTKVIEALWS